MRLLFLSWRDIRSPKSGGAEVHTHGLMQCFLKEGCELVHFSPLYEGLEPEEEIDGIRYIRKGGIFSVIYWAKRYYKSNRLQLDYVVDQCNTHRFFTRFWVPQSKRIFYIHQLTREIWDINLPFPFSWIGKRAETWMLRLQRKDWTITVSESTKQDLVDVGFDVKKIFVVPNAANNEILGRELPDLREKNKREFIYVGRYSKYKGIDAALEALGIVKRNYSDVKLHIVGKKDESFIKKVIMPITEEFTLSYGDSPSNDIILHGFVSDKEKYDLMRKCRALLFPSMREGWGIIVTEAAALGTPSIVYDSPGCKDAVDFGRAGYLCKNNNMDELAYLMIKTIENEDEYKIKRKNAYEFAQRLSWLENQKKIGVFISRLSN